MQIFNWGKLHRTFIKRIYVHILYTVLDYSCYALNPHDDSVSVFGISENMFIENVQRS